MNFKRMVSLLGDDRWQSVGHKAYTGINAARYSAGRGL
jgi:hypothetical protein